MKHILFALGFLFMAECGAAELCRVKVEEGLASSQSYTAKLDSLLDMEEKCGGDHYYDLVKARLLATNKRFDEALAVVSAKPDFGIYEEHFVILQARVYAARGSTREAMRVLKGFLRNHSQSAAVQLVLGKLLSSEQRFDEALEHFIASAKIEPMAEAYQAAAVAFYALGNCDQAVSSVDQAAVLDEKTFHDLGSMLVMSRCYAMQGKFVVATNALKMLLHNNPAAEENSDFQEALSDLRKRIRKAKESGDAATDAHLVTLKGI